MSDLLECIQIFLKYRDDYSPFYCAHEEFQVHDYPIEMFSPEDAARLMELGFHYGESNGGEACWYSFRFGD